MQRLDDDFARWVEPRLDQDGYVARLLRWYGSIREFDRTTEDWWLEHHVAARIACAEHGAVLLRILCKAPVGSGRCGRVLATVRNCESTRGPLLVIPGG